MQIEKCLLNLHDGNGTTNIFAVGGDDHAHWIQYSSNSGWTDSVLDPNTIFVSGSSLALYAASGGVSLFAVGEDGYVKQDQYVQSTGKWSGFFTVHGANTTLQFGAGTPLSIAPLSQIDIFGVLPNGDVGQIQFGSNWDYYDLSGLGAGFIASGANAGSPLTVVAPNGQIDIFGVNASGYVAQVQFTGTQWLGFPIHGTSALGLARGAPLNAAIYGGSVIEIFGITQAGALVQLYFNGGWGYGGVNGYAGFNASSQVSINTSGGVLEVFARFSTGHLANVAFSSSWNEYDLG